MTHNLSYRVWVARLVTITLVACGSFAGYSMGRTLVLQLAANRLNQYLMITAAQDDATFAEARSVLNSLVNSPHAFCSDSEISDMQGFIFRSEFLKDAGRVRGGKIECSAAGGHMAQSIGPLKPESRQDDGIVAYSNFAPMRDARVRRPALQLGSAYVVLGSNLPPVPGRTPLHLSIANQTAAQKQSNLPAGGASQANGLNLTADGSGRIGDTLYATRCSSLQFNCVTASTTVPEVMHGEADTLSASSVLGGLLGLLFGMAFSFQYGRNRDLDHQLRRAVERGGLQVVYQPIVDLPTRQIVGAEALSRWTDEEGNQVDPEVFIGIAERLGFIGGITKSVLNTALRDFAEVFEKQPGFRLSLNVAAPDLVDPKLVPMIEESLKKAKLKPSNLVIEITERSACNSREAMETIRILRRKGHSIHIDDFGTGASNLDKLLYLFADTIKIDKAFTKVIGTESVAVAILPQILAMAKSLNLEVVVEGVETDHQADYFLPTDQQLFGQGWLYGRPVTAEKFCTSILSDALSPAEASADPVADFNEKHGALFVVNSRVA